jgi:hypothetical protein
VIPELGPSLGLLAAPPDAQGAGVAARIVPLDALRLELVTGLFDRASAARGFVSVADREQAVQALGRAQWIELWDTAVTGAARSLVAGVNVRLAGAAAEARVSRRRRRRLALGEDDERSLTVRLGSAGGAFVAALDRLEGVALAAARDPAAEPAWRDALLGAARRLESAWAALEAGVLEEERYWLGEVERVRAWRRPRWPLWLITALLLALAAWIGLVLGAWLPVPAPLEGLAEWWWARS